MEATSKDRAELECSGTKTPKLEATDAALEPPTLTVPTKRGPHFVSAPRKHPQRKHNRQLSELSSVASDATAIGRRIYPAHEIEHKQDRHSRETDEEKCRTCCSRCGEDQRGREQHGGTARDGSAARRHSSFLPAHLLTDTRGLPPTDTEPRPPVSPSVRLPADLAPDCGGSGCGRGGAGRRGMGRRAEIWGGGEWDLKHVRQAAAASRLPSSDFTAAAARHSLCSAPQLCSAVGGVGLYRARFLAARE